MTRTHLRSSKLSWFKAMSLFLSTLLLAFSQLSFAQVEPLRVQGNQVLVGGVAKSLPGHSMFWSNTDGARFYNADAVSWLKSDWNSRVVRAAMGINPSWGQDTGYLAQPEQNRQRVIDLIDAAIANDMYVIIDWHSHKAEQEEAAAIAFFQDMATRYGQHENVIYEVYNEPEHQSWSGTIKPYAEKVISAIRAIDPDNLIVVGTRQWSQRVDEAARDPINDVNVAYALHFYVGSHGADVRGWAQEAMNLGAALFATEWGIWDFNNPDNIDHQELQAWMSFLQDNNISNAAFAINDKVEPTSFLVEGAASNGGWTSYTDAGNAVRDHFRNWPDIIVRPCEHTTIPARIEAEDYCLASGIRIESTSDIGGGDNVGWLDAGDWLMYPIHSPSVGQTEITVRVSSMQGGGAVRIMDHNTEEVLGQIEIPSSGGWQNWQSISQSIQLPAGDMDLRLEVVSGGWNINWFELNVALCSSPVAPGCGNTLPALQVQGNQITAEGNPVSLAGNSLFFLNFDGDKFATQEILSSLRNDWNTSVIRVPIFMSSEHNLLRDNYSETVARVSNIIELAIANDLYVVLSLHIYDHSGMEALSEAYQYFVEMSGRWGHSNNVIYDPWSIPSINFEWQSDIKPYMETIIGGIRSQDPDNLIISGTPFFSQRVHEAAVDPINDSNIAYALSFSSVAHGDALKADITTAVNNGAAIFVNEWFTTDFSSDAPVGHEETRDWMSFLRGLNISHLNWSFHDSGMGAALISDISILDNIPNEALTESGHLVKDIIQSWNVIPIQDDDRDGVPNHMDQCPNTPAGTIVDQFGCAIDVRPLIQAEDYTSMQGIQTEATTDDGGGLNVGWIDAGDWMIYDAVLPTNEGNTYQVNYRVASESGGGQLRIEEAHTGVVFGTINIPNTGGWQNWQTISHTVTIPAGTEIAISAASGGWNLNWFEFQAVPVCLSCPVEFNFEAEDYTQMSGIQTESTSDVGGGLNVGWTDAGDWMTYQSVEIPVSGTYRIEYRVASNGVGGRLQFEKAGGGETYGQIDVPNTGGWQNWQTVSHELQLTAGSHEFAIAALSGGWNINWFRISPVN